MKKQSKYLKLDQQAIRRDYPEVFKKYEGTAMVTARPGVKVDLRKLKAGESVLYGDGMSFHFLLTKVSG